MLIDNAPEIKNSISIKLIIGWEKESSIEIKLIWEMKCTYEKIK